MGINWDEIKLKKDYKKLSYFKRFDGYSFEILCEERKHYPGLDWDNGKTIYAYFYYFYIYDNNKNLYEFLREIKNIYGLSETWDFRVDAIQEKKSRFLSSSTDFDRKTLKIGADYLHSWDFESGIVNRKPENGIPREVAADVTRFKSGLDWLIIRLKMK